MNEEIAIYSSYLRDGKILSKDSIDNDIEDNDIEDND
jgi:hypothetical protein